MRHAALADRRNEERRAGPRQPLTAAELVRQTLCLTTRGRLHDGEVRDWEALLAFAARERCAALAWLRSGDVVRALAPAEIAERWRALFLGISARGHAQLAVAVSATDALAAANVRALWVKGAPLAERLYGDASVRASTDVDLVIPARSRGTAAAVLQAGGWTRVEGGPEGEETFATTTAHGDLYLELHSSLLHPRFDYLPVPPPEGEAASVGGHVVRAHAGALVPAYLAAHLATHSFPPLLWTFDLATLWESLDERARGASLAAARDAGLDRYLRWALRRARLLRLAADGDARAASALGYGGDGRRDVHAMWRHIRLAPSPRAGWRALMAWVNPPWVRTVHGGIVRGTVARAARHWRSALGRTMPPTALDAEETSPRGAAVARLEARRLLDVARAATAVGGEMWIVVTGHSMQPTLAPGDRVLLAPAREHVRRGEIVLLDVAGAPVLHRVVAVDGETILTRGDGCTTDDAPAPVDAVVARALAVARGGVVSALGASARFGVPALARYARARARVVVARASRRTSRAPEGA